MRILALDLATRTGYAHTDGLLGAHKFDWKGVPNGGRWAQFECWLSDVLIDHPCDAIVYEASLYQKGAAAHVANALVAFVEVFAHEGELKLKGYAVSTIKKHATGNGRAEKADMIAAAKKRGMVLNDHDAVDALFLLDLALNDGELTSPTPE